MSTINTNTSLNHAATTTGNTSTVDKSAASTLSTNFTALLGRNADTTTSAISTLVPGLLKSIQSNSGTTDNTVNTPMNTAVKVSVTGGSATLQSFTQPANGKLTQVGNELVYTPKNRFQGSDSFTYTNTSGTTTTVTLSVGTSTSTNAGTGWQTGMLAPSLPSPSTAPIIDPLSPIPSPPAPVSTNTAPVAKNDTVIAYGSIQKNLDFQTYGKTTTTIDVLANDTDADGDTLTIESFTKPAHGTITQSDGKLIYTPDSDYVGTDTLSYTISDGKGGTSTASININVAALPQAHKDVILTIDSTTNIMHVVNRHGSFDVRVKPGFKPTAQDQIFMNFLTPERATKHESNNTQAYLNGWIYQGSNASTATTGLHHWKDPYGRSHYVGSPVALDLNQDGKISTTGQTTAKDRLANTTVGKTVQFDLDADGKLDTTEWMSGNGDGLLVDTTKIGRNNAIDGRALFGDQGGKFANGYDKMALKDKNGDGKLTGAELNKLAVWVDDGDAVLEAGELRQLSEYGITELSTGKTDVKNERGETLMQSTATANGKKMLTEDVWFGLK